MLEDKDMEKIRPLLIEENSTPAEVRRYSRRLARELTEQLAPRLPEGGRTLFVFVLRGAMLLYPPFAEKFEDASFTFVVSGCRTELDCMEYDTAVIVDTVVETGRTVLDAKKQAEESGICAKDWLLATVCANRSARDMLESRFDGVFCLAFLENVRVTIDAGKFAACGNGAQSGQG